MFRFLTEHHTKIILHAASYKHVLLLEKNCCAAVTNNVFPLLHLLEAADSSGCRTFVSISTDKAVAPTNVMGATKRVCELIVSSHPTRNMCSVSVRFGNVLGSNGSVVPILREQLRNNQALTITHPEMTRFFMTAQEAAALVLQASGIGAQGDIRVLDMCWPVRILDLAHSLICLSGKSPDEVKIHFMGLRPGEKLHEQICYSTEEVLPTSFPRIRRARGKLLNWNLLKHQLEVLRQSLSVDGPAPIRAALKKIVPEYSYSPEAHF